MSVPSFAIGSLLHLALLFSSVSCCLRPSHRISVIACSPGISVSVFLLPYSISIYLLPDGNLRFCLSLSPYVALSAGGPLGPGTVWPYGAACAKLTSNMEAEWVADMASAQAKVSV